MSKKKLKAHNKRLIKIRARKARTTVMVKRSDIHNAPAILTKIRTPSRFMSEVITLSKADNDRQYSKDVKPRTHKEKQWLCEYVKPKFGSVRTNNGQQKTVFDEAMSRTRG